MPSFDKFSSVRRNSGLATSRSRLLSGFDDCSVLLRMAAHRDPQKMRLQESLTMGLKEKLIQETATLIKGDTFTVVRNGVEIIFRLFWETEDFPSLDVQSVKLTRKASFLEQLLIDNFVGWRNRGLRDIEWYPSLSKTKPFLDWDRRIKKVCDQAKILEETKKIDFHRHILEPAEISLGIRTIRVPSTTPNP
jgi:hypothetical protein